MHDAYPYSLISKEACFQEKYFDFIEDVKIDLEISENMTYGIHGKAAPWGDMIGGAEQIVTPFSGQDMLDLGIMIQRR